MMRRLPCQQLLQSSFTTVALFQYDPQGQWGTLKLSRQDADSDEEVALPTVATKFPHCLIDSSLVVRLFMANSMKRSVHLSGYSVH